MNTDKYIVFTKEPKYDQPWGGGNRFLVEFISHLRSKNIPVAYRKDEATVEMFEKHLDDTAMFFLLEPTDLYTSDNNNISFDSVFEKIRQRDIKLVQRIGNVGSHRNINFYLAAFETCAKYIDCAIFTSEWALNQVSAAGIHYKHSIVIRNVANKDIWQNKALNYTDIKKLRCVTHHWSDNMLKGFDIYKQLDKLNFINFTYIGRKPDDCLFKNYIEPQTQKTLPALLSNNHVYISASIGEAGPWHIVEALMCGLPVLYHKNGGACAEYVGSCGEGYSSFSELVSLLCDMNWYSAAKKAVDARAIPPSDLMVKKYFQAIETIK